MRILYCSILVFCLLATVIIFPVSADLMFNIDEFCFHITNISQYPDYIFILYPSTNETGYTIIKEGDCYRLTIDDRRPSLYAVKKIDFEKIQGNSTSLNFLSAPFIPSYYSFKAFDSNFPSQKLQEVREVYSIESINNVQLFVNVTGCTYYFNDGNSTFFSYNSTASRPNRYHRICWGPGCTPEPTNSTTTIPTTTTHPIPLNTTVEIPTTQSAWLIPSIIAGIVIAGIVLVRRKKGL